MRLPKIALAAASITFAFSSTAARAEYCQPGSAGCVLPLPGAAPAAGPVTATPMGEPIVEEVAGGFNFLPFLLAAAVIAIGLYFLLDEDEEVSP
jgi:hypothetical protein